MNEMTAKEYAKQFKRICATYRESDSEVSCEGCPFGSEFLMCNSAVVDRTDKAIELVSKWAEEHPERTYKQDFLSKFPNASNGLNGEVLICRKHVYGGKGLCYETSECFKCWDEVMPEVQK